MVIIAISGSGIGAGKTSLAKKFGYPIWSLAGGLRSELSRIYPNYNWENRTQAYKDGTTVKEAGGRTIRKVLIDHGKEACEKDPFHYVRLLTEKLKSSPATNQQVVAIDDVRKVLEVEYLRQKFPGQVVHFHLDWEGAIPEPEFENHELGQIADYTLIRQD